MSAGLGVHPHIIFKQKESWEILFETNLSESNDLNLHTWNKNVLYILISAKSILFDHSVRSCSVATVP